MPLPPYLLERLKKRGVIQSSSGSSNVDRSHHLESSSPKKIQSIFNEASLDEEHEEIIAEDYSDEENQGSDDYDSNRDKQQDGHDQISMINLTRDDETSVDNIEGTMKEKSHHSSGDQIDPSKSVLGCPNKYNIYHECSQYCLHNYREPKQMTPSLEQRKQLAIILRTYPMSNEWTVVYDPGVKTFYFWNIITNLVSWLPPSMKGAITQSADEIRLNMKLHQDQALANRPISASDQ